MSRPRLLLIDDEPQLAAFVANAAAMCGFEPISTERDHDFREQFVEARPEMVVLDLGMPGMDGFEICRQIKRDPLIRDTKVVVMTARSLDAEPCAMEAGADGILFKPLEAAAVHRLLVRLLGARR